MRGLSHLVATSGLPLRPIVVGLLLGSGFGRFQISSRNRSLGLAFPSPGPGPPYASPEYLAFRPSNGFYRRGSFSPSPLKGGMVKGEQRLGRSSTGYYSSLLTIASRIYPQHRPPAQLTAFTRYLGNKRLFRLFLHGGHSDSRLSPKLIDTNTMCLNPLFNSTTPPSASEWTSTMEKVVASLRMSFLDDELCVVHNGVCIMDDVSPVRDRLVTRPGLLSLDIACFVPYFILLWVLCGFGFPGGRLGRLAFSLLLKGISSILVFGYTGAGLVFYWSIYALCLPDLVVDFVVLEVLFGVLACMTWALVSVYGMISWFCIPGSVPMQYTLRQQRLVKQFHSIANSMVLFTSPSPSPSPSPATQTVDFAQNPGILTSKRVSRYDPTRQFYIIRRVARSGPVKIVLVWNKSTKETCLLRSCDLTGPYEKHARAELKALGLLTRNECVWTTPMLAAFSSGDKMHVLTMHYPRGTMRDYMFSNLGYLDRDVALFYLAEMFIAIQALHMLGIIHLRISIDDILLTEDGHLVLSNFTFAKIFDNGVVPEYLRPRDALEDVVFTGAIDYYYMALVHHEMLTGRPHPSFTHRRDYRQKPTIMESSFWSSMISFFPHQIPYVPDIKRHPIFENIDWDGIEERTIEPPVCSERKRRRWSDAELDDFEEERLGWEESRRRDLGFDVHDIF